MKTISTNNYYITQLLEKELLIDTTEEKGGSGKYIRPHDLLEAALAACMNISLKKEAEKLGISDIVIETEVSLNRNNPSEAIFEYNYKILNRDISDDVRNNFDIVLKNCAVRKTLLKNIFFNKNEEK